MIERELHGHVVVLKMQHGKANALDLEFCEGLSRAFEDVRASSARGVVLTGAGAIFGAGVDLKRLLAAGTAYTERFLPAMAAMFERVFLFPRPVVAAINGHAVAGGCLLAACADRRFLAYGAVKMGVPELRVGLPFPAAGLEALRLVVPHSRLQDLVYGGRMFTGEEALRAGLADELVHPPELLARSIEEAERLGAFGEAFRATKEQIRQPARQFLAANAQRLDHNAVDVWRRPATLEAVRRYVETTLR